MRRFLILILAMLLAACGTTTPAAPTATLLPSKTPSSGQPALPTATRTLAPKPTGTAETPTPEPSPTATVTSTPLPPPPGADLGTGVWQWAALQPAKGDTVKISEPDKFSIAFLAEGKLNLQADCAVTGGSYQANGSSLSIRPAMAADLNCLPGSRAAAFLQSLAATASYSYQDGYLVLALQDGGTMKLVSRPVVAPEAPSADGGKAVAKTFATVRAGPGLEYPVYGILPAGAIAGLAAKNFDSGWWALKMPGFPDQMGWVPPASIEVSNPDKVPWQQIIFLQIGEKLLWPEVNEPRASVTAPVFLYAGPGKPYPVLLVGLPGDTYYVVGRSADSQYLVLYLGKDRVPGGLGWVEAKSVEKRNLEQVIVYQPPAQDAIRPNVYQPGDGDAVAAPLAAANLRSGPYAVYPVLDLAMRGEPLHILGQSSDRMWWVVEVPASVTADRKAYVAQSITRAVNADNVAVLPDPFPPLFGQFEKVGRACTVVKRDPQNLQVFKRGEDFNAEFEILNDTGQEWPDGDVDFVFVGNIDNANIHLGPNRYKITDLVLPGQTATLSFSAEAVKKHRGDFGELWVVRMNGETICSFDYYIRVIDWPGQN